MSRKHPICPYDDEASVLQNGMQVYNRYDLRHRWFYICPKCDARVGCHPGTKNPLGRMADAELRSWKNKAHAAFDPLWKEKSRREKTPTGKARRAGYKWLAEQLGIPVKQCHVGQMDIDLCKQVVEICSG